MRDFSALWLLHTNYAELERLPWPTAVWAAMGMSMVSLAGYGGRGELVDYHLTGRVVAVSDL